MIHPIVQELFDEESKGAETFHGYVKIPDNIEEIDEFIKWHQDANRQVIDEILKIKKIDSGNSEMLRNWAVEFLENYDKNIRELREISNKVFERFQYLKKNNFEKLKNEHPNHGEEIRTNDEFISKSKWIVDRKKLFLHIENHGF